MIPKTLSASALNVAQLCLSRYQAEYIARGRGANAAAASLGTACHGALEMYVKACYLEKNQQPTLKLLLDLFRMSYMTTFGTSDTETDDYADGVSMLTAWFERTSFANRRVVSCEVKSMFPIKTSIGEIPLNYIWDRFDELEDAPGEYEVVDYKTNRFSLRPEDLKKKVQARVYALAAQIQMPQATKIWVRFDLLRHDSVGVVFTREENAATWRFIKEEAERIIATPDDKAPETLNPECRFCVRKTTCGALERNVGVGGSFGLTIPEMIDRRAALQYQIKAIESAIGEMDEAIITEAKAQDVEEFYTDMNRLYFGISSRRSVDAERVAKVVGDDVFRKYGGIGITMADFDKLCKDPAVDAAKKAQLKSLVYQRKGEPTVKVEPRDPIGSV